MIKAAVTIMIRSGKLVAMESERVSKSSGVKPRTIHRPMSGLLFLRSVAEDTSNFDVATGVSDKWLHDSLCGRDDPNEDRRRQLPANPVAQSEASRSQIAAVGRPNRGQKKNSARMYLCDGSARTGYG